MDFWLILPVYIFCITKNQQAQKKTGNLFHFLKMLETTRDQKAKFTELPLNKAIKSKFMDQIHNATKKQTSLLTNTCHTFSAAPSNEQNLILTPENKTNALTLS